MPVCRTCGQENPDGFRFCGACGAALQQDDAPAGEERKVVTALFTDIVGSTAKAEGLDPEDVRARLAPYYDRLRTELERFGGTVEKFIGDAVVALFGAPIAHEDDPERAVRAALAIRDAIGELNAADPWLDLQVRTGVNTGEALIVLGAAAVKGEGMAAGDVMNTAARIQSGAPVDGVLVTESTYRATAHAIEYREAEPVQAKGKAEPVPAWEAIAVKELPSRRPVSSLPLVGRDAELESLSELLEHVRTTRRPAVATLVGPAGIGKSRLLAEIADRSLAGADVHWGRCLPYGEGITYWPVTEILKDAAGILQSDEPDTMSAKLGALLEQLGTDSVDELRTMAAALANLVGVPSTPLGTYSATEITQAELHWGIRRLLRLRAANRPSVLVFEDLHWAEPTLLDLIRYLAEDAADAPLFILTSARPELVEENPAILTGDGNRRVVELTALSEEQSQTLLAGLLEAEDLAGRPMETVLTAAGGNPLFLEETVRMLADADLSDRDSTMSGDIPVPSTLQALIGSRLDQLPTREKRLAQNASVIGGVFWPGAISHLNGIEGDLRQGLAALERRDFIRVHEVSTVAGEREYGFKHILIRDVAYGQLPKGRRAELHLRFADWIGALPGTEDEFVEIVAYHLEQSCKLARRVVAAPIAAPVVDAARALAHAAEKAERREGLREADRYYARALELVGDDHPELATELKVAGARILVALGELAKARQHLLEVAETASELDRLDLRGAALVALANIDQKQGRAAAADDRLTEAETIASQIGDRVLQIRAGYEFAALRADFEGASQAAVEGLRRTLVIAEEIGARALRVEGHLRLGFLLFNIGKLAHCEEELQRCVTLAHEVGSHRDEARATWLLGLVKYYSGDIEEAERLNLQARDWLERTCETYFQTQNLSRALALYALARGEPMLAEERLQEALALALEGGGWVVAEIYRYLVEALVCQDRVDEARALADFAASGVSGEDRQEQALVLVAQGITAEEPAIAAERFDEALRLLTEVNMPIELGEARLALARTLRRLGDGTEARVQLEFAREAFAQMEAWGMLVEVERELERVGAASG